MVIDIDEARMTLNENEIGESAEMTAQTQKHASSF
jgi:hypothetical protein